MCAFCWNIYHSFIHSCHLRIWGCLHNWVNLPFWGCPHIWGYLILLIIFLFEVIFIFEVGFKFVVGYIFEVILKFELIFKYEVIFEFNFALVVSFCCTNSVIIPSWLCFKLFRSADETRRDETRRRKQW